MSMARKRKSRLDGIPVEVTVRTSYSNSKHPASGMSEGARQTRQVEILAGAMRRALSGRGAEAGSSPIDSDIPKAPKEETQVLSRDEWLSGAEVMRFLHIRRTTLWRLGKSGRLPSHKVGGRRLYPRSDVQAYVESARTSEEKGAAA